MSSPGSISHWIGELKAGGFDLRFIPQILNKLLRLDDLLTLIEPDRAKWPNLHLVLLPAR